MNRSQLRSRFDWHRHRSNEVTFLDGLVDENKLHGQLLTAPHGNGLMVHHNQQILVGSNCYDLPIESYRFNCVAAHVKNSDFLLIENSHPATAQSHTFNSVPGGLPHLSFNSWCQFQTHFLLTCIHQTKRVDVKMLERPVVRKYVFSGPFKSELDLD